MVFELLLLAGYLVCAAIAVWVGMNALYAFINYLFKKIFAGSE